jgi:hypothetical protein
MDSLIKRLANLLFMNRKERKAIESKTHQTKQQTRRENITQRQDAKKERQIAKREKKLLRPGFEGRKEGFINT